MSRPWPGSASPDPVPPGSPPSRHAWPEVGEVVVLSAAGSRRWTSSTRSRGGAARMRRSRWTGCGGPARGGVGWPGRSTGCGGGRRWGSLAGCPAKEAALLRGMVLGQDERLSEAVRTDFQRSGLAHILAVSGQNVVLLAMLALAAGMVAGIGLRARLAVALALVVVYVPLAGGGPSIQRAGVMGGAGLVAALAGRPASRWYALGLAAAATLALNPRVSGEPGWQLSFAAVVGLLALVPRWREGLRRAGLPGPVADAAAVTAAATVATAPLMAFHFEQVSLASLPANLAAAAAVAPVMWLGMVAIAVAQVSPALCAPLNALNGPLLAYVEWVAHVAAQPPAAALPVRLGGPATLAVAYAALAALIALAGRASRWTASRGPHPRSIRVTAAVVGVLGVGVVVVPALGTPRPPQPGDFVISFLNIGQGDATLLQHGGASILFDTGPPGGPILTRLRQAGVKRLDALVLTHAQLDHEGMAVPITRKYHPRLVLDGGAGWNTPTQRGCARTWCPRTRTSSSSWAASACGCCGRRGRRPAGAPRATRTTAPSWRSRASGASTCSSPPTPSRTSPARCSCRPSRSSRSPTTAARTPACRRCWPARARRSRASRSAAATPTGTRRNPPWRSSEPPSRTSTGPTATAPSAST